MCPKKEWFNTYELFKRDIVLRGDDIACKTVGIGNIYMKMFDAKVRTLEDVKHVSDLRKNLLSLEALELKDASSQTRMEL